MRTFRVFSPNRPILKHFSIIWAWYPWPTVSLKSWLLASFLILQDRKWSHLQTWTRWRRIFFVKQKNSPPPKKVVILIWRHLVKVLSLNHQQVQNQSSQMIMCNSAQLTARAHFQHNTGRKNFWQTALLLSAGINYSRGSSSTLGSRQVSPFSPDIHL